MKGPFYVETLARNGDVLHRHAIAQLPIRIGRGYDNDYILDDAYAAPRHAVVEEGPDGGLLLRDLGSVNGIVHRGRRRDALALDGHTVVRMGHTTLRIRAADFDVGPELVDRTRHGWEGALPGLAGALLILVSWIGARWANDPSAFQPLRYILQGASVLGVALAWSGAWTLANNMFARQTRLGRHLFITGCFLAAMTLYGAVSSVLAYAFSLEGLVRYDRLVVVALAALAIFYHLSTVKPAYRHRYRAVSITLAVAGCGLVLLSNYLRSGRLADEPYMAVLLPPAVRVSPDHSVDDFIGRAQSLKARLDVERTRKVRDLDDDEDD
ncbi:MAG TPA: FHA domain-containing protein [Telluria sp.]|nr:FHA domain-containing protein [Telluria sp.]